MEVYKSTISYQAHRALFNNHAYPGSKDWNVSEIILQQLNLERDAMNITELIKNGYQNGLNELDIVVTPLMFTQLEEILKMYRVYAPFSIDFVAELLDDRYIIRARYKLTKVTFKESRWYVNYEDKYKKQQIFFMLNPKEAEDDTNTIVVDNIIDLMITGYQKDIRTLEIEIDRQRYLRIEKELPPLLEDLDLSIDISCVTREASLVNGQQNTDFVLIVRYNESNKTHLRAPEYLPFCDSYAEHMIEQDVDAIHSAILRCKEHGFSKITFEIGTERFQRIDSRLIERLNSGTVSVQSLANKETGTVVLDIVYSSPTRNLRYLTDIK